jgi:hypothetical protein
MRTTLNLSEDAVITARNLAQREQISLGTAVSMLVRRGASVGDATLTQPAVPVLRGRFALLPTRDEVIGSGHVRELMEPEVT